MRCDAMSCDAMRCDAMRCDAMQIYDTLFLNDMFVRTFGKQHWIGLQGLDDPDKGKSFAAKQSARRGSVEETRGGTGERAAVAAAALRASSRSLSRASGRFDPMRTHRAHDSRKPKQLSGGATPTKTIWAVGNAAPSERATRSTGPPSAPGISVSLAQAAHATTLHLQFARTASCCCASCSCRCVHSIPPTRQHQHPSIACR